jgi:hypothetical protein
MDRATIGVAFVLALAVWAGCGNGPTTTSSGGSSGSSGTTDAGSCANTLDSTTASVCTTNVKWTRGDRGSSQMHPGGECITCHAGNAGPDDFAFAGTVFATAHEPDDCNGVNGTTAKLTVVVTGADGVETKATVNSVGNFYTSGTITTPFSAKIVDGSGNERAMCVQQDKIDCNTCHTAAGKNDAPGRIAAP